MAVANDHPVFNSPHTLEIRSLSEKRFPHQIEKFLRLEIYLQNFRQKSLALHIRFCVPWLPRNLIYEIFWQKWHHSHFALTRSLITFNWLAKFRQKLLYFIFCVRQTPHIYTCVLYIWPKVAKGTRYHILR